MPFKSEAQRRLLFLKKPKLAEKWAHKYGTPDDLPYHKKKKKKKKEEESKKSLSEQIRQGRYNAAFDELWLDEN